MHLVTLKMSMFNCCFRPLVSLFPRQQRMTQITSVCLDTSFQQFNPLNVEDSLLLPELTSKG